MQNSFEKQVQDKMEELRFQPTDPVWLKVEAQIRKKKSRRRFFFWLFPLLLALGGGAYWMLGGNQKLQDRVTAATPPQHKNEINEKGGSGTLHAPGTLSADLPAKHRGEEHKNTAAPAAAPTYSPGRATPANEQERSAPSSPEMARTEVSGTTASATRQASSRIKQVTAEKKQALPGSTETATPFDPPAKPQADAGTPGAREGVKAAIPLAPQANEKKSDSAAAATAVPVGDSSKVPVKDSVVLPQLVKKEGASKPWTIGMRLGGGLAASVSGLDIFAEEREYSFDPTAGGVSNPLNQPSQPVRNNIHLSAGLEIGRSLSPRLRVKSGLQYHYYSTSVKVGQLLRQDTVISNGGMLDQFYSNTGGGFRDYTNRYHFLALPLSVEWQAHARVPLFVEAGFSVQQLLSSNALVFDPAARVYYADDAALNRTSLFAHGGLSYAVLSRKGTQLRLGPQLQYGLTRLSRNGSNKHLVSLGLSATLQFQK